MSPARKDKSSSVTQKFSEIDKLAQALLQLDTQLNSNIPATLFISDLHGEGDRFISILRGRFGMLYQTCIEALPKTFSTDKIQYLVKIIRKQRYIKDDNIKMDMQDIIMCFIEILRYKFSNIDRTISESLGPEYRSIISRLISGLPVPDYVFEEDIISERIIHYLSQSIKKVLLDRIMVLGDIFDRGPQPDKIIRILSSKWYKDMVYYVFGNHDILWMGAAAGSRSLIAEAMRISSRYDHMDLMHRLGFDISKLVKFAVSTYPAEKVTGKFKAKTDQARSMEKALAVIQFKLEEKTIKKHPEFGMDSRLWLKKLATMLKNGKTELLNDTHFPTIDLSNPHKLTKEEQEVINDLEYQFKTNKKLKKLLDFFFDKGQTYIIHNDMLNIHALIPSNQNREFEEFLNRRGKDLLDHVQESIERIGKAYLSGKKQREKDLALMFYLWCGPKSPFFGKDAMKTFERYFLLDKETHKERTLYWSKNLETDEFKQLIMQEFGTNRIIFGHTPVDFTKGKQMASGDGVAINIDGGFAAAYYNRGHALVHTPFQLYGIILPTPEELKQASLNLETVPLSVEIIDQFYSPVKFKDTSEGKLVKAKRDKIINEIRSLS
ncbi:MAG: fructose-1,6-bisphosphatase [Proteobacteria bacterium]|nr:fructose-1,6-bisphosphatase [Pseudomonadota bacterium]